MQKQYGPFLNPLAVCSPDFTCIVSILITILYLATEGFIKKEDAWLRLHDSIVVSIPACHAGDRGSIPRRGAFLNSTLQRRNEICEHIYMQYEKYQTEHTEFHLHVTTFSLSFLQTKHW